VTALLTARGVERTFTSAGSTIRALDDVSLDVEAGEFITIVGPSGCGKSTFLHMIGGFDQPTSGRIELLGLPVTKPGPDRGMMFQDLALYPWLTVLENVRWPLDVKGLAMVERKRLAQQAVDLVHLSGMEALYPAQLSGGMKQRVALARVVALDPDIMLMDEPFGALDAQTRELLQDELMQIWRLKRKTALFVTHDIDEAIFLGTRVLVFTARPGRIKADFKVPAGPDRGPEFRMTPEYNALRVEIWRLLREEVVKTHAASTGSGRPGSSFHGQ
jgi:NitT/TauT family transport system ATP-binding protein